MIAVDLNATWFVLVFVLLAGYAILDGYDLGVGMLHLTLDDETERRLCMNAIGPVWDGNEVWLLTAGGALFAAFPSVYATVFSAFYVAIFLLLLALILRAVSFEFRGKVDDARWRRGWDLAFGWGSLGTALLLGVAFGNVLGGIPLDAAGEYHGSFVGLLDPFALLVGLAGSALFVMQGASYLSTKTDGELRARMRVWRGRGWAAFVVLFAAVVVAALFAARHLFEGALQDPLAWAFFLVLVGALLYVPLAARSRRDGCALLASSLAIGSVMGLAAANLFPRLAPSSLDLAASLTAYGHSSTPYALRVMLAIALLGMPLVLAYTIWIHRIFRGKVVLDEHSY